MVSPYSFVLGPRPPIHREYSQGLKDAVSPPYHLPHMDTATLKAITWTTKMHC